MLREEVQCYAMRRAWASNGPAVSTWAQFLRWNPRVSYGKHTPSSQSRSPRPLLQELQGPRFCGKGNTDFA